ncbi:MAG: hypothetical protein ACFFD6_09010 [Candidatus Thorarchaeota archaeon]
MSKTKWVMKQYWRVGTIRALLSLALSMFVLGRLYYVYIPVLSDWGLFGALILGSFLVLLFMFLGWAYDEKIRLWSQKVQASTERNLYQYISNFRTYALDYPAYYGYLTMMRRILDRVGLETDPSDEIFPYMDRYFKRKPSRKDIFSALPDAERYSERHPFERGATKEKQRVSIGARAKLGFQVQLLRLTWAQSLTGLAQDVLVFGAFYVTLFVTDSPDVVGEIVSLDYLILGILFISLPLFFVLAGLGWVYDKKLRVWTPDSMVKIERNPYTFLSEPYLHVMLFPMYIGLFRVMRQVYQRAGLDPDYIDRYAEYFGNYIRLDVSRDENMQAAKSLRREFGPIFVKSSEEVNKE